jgi:type II secretion system protein H
MRTRRGTSLVEMLIVLVLLGVLTSVAAPLMKPSTKGAVEQNARLLAQDLDHARTKAYAARTRVRVVVGDTIWRAYLDDNRDSVFAESAAEQTAFGNMNTRVIERGVVFGRGTAMRLLSDTAVSYTPGTRRVQFGTRGTTDPFGTNLVLYMTHTDDASAVTAIEINSAANVRIWRWVEGVWQ